MYNTTSKRPGDEDFLFLQHNRSKRPLLIRDRTCIFSQLEALSLFALLSFELDGIPPRNTEI